MGFIKKALFGSKTPKYNQDAAALSGVYGVSSDLGNMTVKKNSDGTYSKVFESSDIDKMRNQLALQGLGALSLDPSDAAQSYYDANTRLLQNQFDRQTANTDEALINRGIQTGTKQYNQVMGDLSDRQNGILSDIANLSVTAGQNYLGNQISNINALTGARDINQVNNMSGTNSAYSDAYSANNVARTNNDARYARMLNTGIQGIGALAGLL